MIELNEKTQQDFLNREWVQRLLEAGVDMSDAKYYIVYDINEQRDYIRFGKQPLTFACTHIRQIPTYTVSELLYKLHEWIYPTIDGEEYSGGLKVSKDAPFYIAHYDLKNKEDNAQHEEFYAKSKYPIESLAMLLIQCHKKYIGIKTKDTKNIDNK